MTDGPYPNHLAEFMRANRLTDPALAGKLGISKQQIFNLRHGDRKLTVQWAIRLAPALGISWERLITGPLAPEDQDRAEWNAVYDALSEDKRRALLTVGKGMISPEPEVPARLPSPKGGAPPRPAVGGSVNKSVLTKARPT